MTGTTRQRNTRNLPRGYFADAQDNTLPAQSMDTRVPRVVVRANCAGSVGAAGDNLGGVRATEETGLDSRSFAGVMSAEVPSASADHLTLYERAMLIAARQIGPCRKPAY